jgi:hypothetical protein
MAANPDRIEQIESNLLLLTRSHAQLQDTVKTIAVLQESVQQSLLSLTTSIGHYVSGADARMKRLEENLDALIRALTAEHGNGRNH